MVVAEKVCPPVRKILNRLTTFPPEMEPEIESSGSEPAGMT